MVFIPQRTTLKIVGGMALAAGTPPIQIAPPWETEEALLVPICATAWGNATTNLLYGGEEKLPLQGNLNLTTQPDSGLVVAINGVGTVFLGPFPIRVQERYLILPAPASGGQIFLMYYWERSHIPGIAMGGIPLPGQDSREPVETRRARVEPIIWKTDVPVKPSELFRKEPEEVTPRMRKQMRTEDFLGDLKGQQKS